MSPLKSGQNSILSNITYKTVSALAITVIALTYACGQVFVTSEITSLNPVKLTHSALTVREAPICGVAQFNAGPHPDCGILFFKKKSKNCKPIKFNRRKSKVCPGYVSPVKEKAGWHCSSKPEPKVKCKADQYKKSQSEGRYCDGNRGEDPVINVYCMRDEVINTCEHPSFGAIDWEECRHQNHGKEGYQTCEHISFGPKTYKKCELRKNELELREYIASVKEYAPIFSLKLIQHHADFLVHTNEQKNFACLIKDLEADPALRAKHAEIARLKDMYENVFGEEYTPPANCTAEPVVIDCSKPSAACAAKHAYEQTRAWFEFHAEEIPLLVQDLVAKTKPQYAAELRELEQLIKEQKLEDL